MSNKILSSILDATTKKFSKNVMDGIAKDTMHEMPQFLNDIIIDSIKSLNKNVDLKYHGYRYLTPKEEFEKMYKSTTNKTTFDLARSDLYMIELLFSYKDEPMNRVLYLPFSRRGNLMTISNTVYHIVPVLSDTVISPNHKEIFARLLKDKITFKNSVRNFIINNAKKDGPVIYAPIMSVNEKQIVDNIGKPMLPVALYLTAKYGIREVFKRYCGIDEIIVTDEDDQGYLNEYAVFKSTKIKPRGMKEYGYNGHDVKFIIPKDYVNDTLVNNIIYGLIYALDILPDTANDLIYTLQSGNVEDEKLFWKIMIGRISYKNSFSVDRIIQDTNDHFDTLEGYIDSYIKNKLSDNNIKIETFFDLIAYILKNYNSLILNSKEYNSDINNRYIDILYYILYDIIVGFNKVILNINRRASKKTTDLTHKEISKIFVNELSPRKIFGLVKSKAMNIAVSLADSSSDIMYPKVTALLEDQSRGRGVRRGSNSQFPENTKLLKAPDLILGSLLFLTKSAPSPRFRANLFLEYDRHSGKIHIPVESMKTITKLDKLLLGRATPNDKILEDDILLDISD